MGNRIPILLMGDAASASTGLGRITRELATRIFHNLDETFRVGSYGLGGICSRHLPFKQYQITTLDNWAPTDLPRIWKDFAGDEKGIVMTIWNPSSLPWLADCEKLPAGTLKDFLRTDPFKVWAYCPIDAEGPNGLLPQDVAQVMAGFDRTLCYTAWSADLLFKTNGLVAPHLPHGTDTHIFYPRDRRESRKNFIGTVTGGMAMPINEDVTLVGICATNSARKSWSLGLEVCQELLRRGVNVGVWAHTDKLKGNWDILALAKAYGLDGRIIPTTTDLSDEQMAEAYSACDVTLGIGLGEGFGMPIFESLACCVPCIHGDYAGAAEFLPAEYKVKPIGFYGEGFYGNRRPVFDVQEFADVVQSSIGQYTILPEGLSWDECWPAWSRWLLEGVNGD